MLRAASRDIRVLSLALPWTREKTEMGFNTQQGTRVYTAGRRVINSRLF